MVLDRLYFKPVAPRELHTSSRHPGQVTATFATHLYQDLDCPLALLQMQSLTQPRTAVSSAASLGGFHASYRSVKICLTRAYTMLTFQLDS